jgi:hypothetical protein
VHALEGLTVDGTKRGFLREIHCGLWEGKSEDAVVLVIRELEAAKGKMLCSLEWMKENDLWHFRDQIYILMIPKLQHKIVEQHHDSWIAGHAGQWKTLELVSQSYWWLNMSRYIGQYCKACDMCLRTKAQQCKPFGKLHPLPIPEARWDIVSVDFITELQILHSFNAAMVMVDSVSK